MAIKEIRIKNFRAFTDTGVVTFDDSLCIVGANDCGKSAVLQGLKLFFEPPKKGGVPLLDIHNRKEDTNVEVELAFDPTKLSATELKFDAKNKIDLAAENLLDPDGLLRLRLTGDSKKIEPLEIFIDDFDDEDLFGVAITGKEKDLLELLMARGLQATPSGKETNAEKRAALRKDAEGKGLNHRSGWLSLGEREKAVRDILPKFALFEDDDNYGIGQTPVQNQFKGVVEKALKLLPETDKIRDEADKALKGEFTKLHGFLSNLTDTVSSVDASASLDWKKAVSAVEVEWTDSFGFSVPFTHRGAGIRRLFMVAYFQYIATESINDPAGPKYVFCVEEPETHLHPSAQRLLLEAFDSLTDLGHSVIFTTHSPVFASSVGATSLALVTRSGIEAEIRQHPDIDLRVVANELGVQATDRLVGKSKVVLVEGESDADFFQEALRLLNEGGHTPLDPAEICFVQCGGIDNLRYMATAQKMDEVGLDWVIIVDSDRKEAGGPVGNQTAKVIDDLPDSCKAHHILERTTLENYFDEAVVSSVVGFEVRIGPYGKPKDTDGVEFGNGRTRRIKSSAAEVCRQMGADGLIEAFLPAGESDPNKSELNELFQKIEQAFSTPVGVS